MITPSYGQLDWLRLAVASVADQSGNGPEDLVVEHLVQDGGSEGFESFAREMAALHPDRPGYRLRMLSEPDTGMYDAINRGLKRATGEICSWLNCDEQYLPGALETVASYFQGHHRADVVFGDTILVDPAGMPLSYRRTVRPDPAHIRLHHLNTPSCATFFRRSTVVDVGHLLAAEWKTIGDAVWMERLLRGGCRAVCLGVPLAVFVITGQNLGAGELAGREAAQWRLSPGAPPAWLAPISRARHLLRRLLGGSYRKRDVAPALFTMGSTTRRVVSPAQKVGWGWVR